MKWVWRIAGGFTLLLVLLGLALFAVPTDRIARLATDKLEEATGRQLTINGDLSARLWPRPGITATSVSLSNAPWSRQGPMLVAERMEVGITPGSILAGQIQIKTLSLTGAAITLERREDGIGNWETAVTQGETTGPTPTGPSIDTISLTGAEIAWIDHRADRTLRLRAVDLTAQLPDPTRPTALQGSALLGSRAIRLGGRVDNLANFMDGGLQHITLSLSSGGTAVTIDGRADLAPLAFDGTIDARSDDRMGILSAMGVPVPTLPEGLGGRRVALTAAATLAPEGSLHLRGLDLALDANRFTGDLDLLPGETRPRLAATLTSNGLTLDTLSAKGLGGESLLVSETGWAREPLDASALGALDADVVLTTGPVRLGDARLAAVAATINLRDMRLVANLQPVRAYGGVIGGELVINARSDLSARAELDFEGVDIRELLDGFAGYDRISGQANASVAVVAEGATAQAMVESLEGDIAVSLTNGEIVGVDLPAMIRDRQGRPADSLATVFDSASAQLRVADGAITGDDIRIDAEGGTLVAQGGLDLGPRQVDLRITPARGATVPVLVEGRWTSPRVAVDRAYLRRQAEAAERARQEAAAAAAAREAAARREREEAATRARLARELGVTPESLTDQNAVEEAVRRRVEQELLDLITGTD